MSSPSPSNCSAIVAEALNRCASLDEGWARSARDDAARCAAHESPVIKARASDMISRAENYEAKAAEYRAALLSLNAKLCREGGEKKP